MKKGQERRSASGRKKVSVFSVWGLGACFVALCLITVQGAFAQTLPGGTIDPTTIPKYVTPLVIPPVMNDVNPGNGTDDKYEIAVREFKQQILPGGLWSTLPGCVGENCTFPPTKVWSYGPEGRQKTKFKKASVGREGWHRRQIHNSIILRILSRLKPINPSTSVGLMIW